MTRLERNALTTIPMSKDAVEAIYALYPRWTLSHLQETVRKLCLSHQRLRAELNGAEILLSEACPHCGSACDLKPARKP